MAIEEQRHRDTTPVAARTHRVHCFAGRAHEVLDDLLGADGSGFVALSELSVSATRESIVELTRLQARLEALKGRLLDHGDLLAIGTAPDDHGEVPAIPATTTASWYAGTVRVPLPLAKKTVKLAKRLEDRFHTTARALAAGKLDAEQAAVIADAVDALPDLVLDHERRAAEEHLVARAAHFDAWALKKLGTHLLEVIDPDGLDEHLAAKLAEEEALAARKTYFTMRDDGHGTVHGRFAIPALDADMLAVALNAIASPKRPDALDREDEGPAGDHREKPAAAVLGEAFCELIERLPADRLPTSGGINATVVVTMTLESLLGGLTPATVDTGRRITAAEARRLASQCGLIPAVLGTRSEVLDLGRSVRLHTTAQRTALRVRHTTCTAEGCTIPAAWCHAHHKTPWARGGRTSINDGTLLCPRHHRAIHRPGITATYADDGTTHITKTVKRRQ